MGPDAEAWTRVFLKHADRFMVGSKAPDDTFKDFKNHVLHVGDNYWGGAPEKVASGTTPRVAALEQQNWDDAVYAAGVLSHYYTDPIHPFHTGQTEAENAIHRAAEWSINRSYDACAHSARSGSRRSRCRSRRRRLVEGDGVRRRRILASLSTRS